MSFKVCITTAGIGSRLAFHTKYLNKSLVSIDNKPTICHILDQFPEDCEFVIAIGYKGKLVKDFLSICYPNKKFIFCDVNPYVGEGSGLGKSLLCCQNYLQEPFVFSSCDTLVNKKITPPTFNWMGYAPKKETSNNFRTLVKSSKNKVIEIQEKGIEKSHQKNIYIGLAGIFDYIKFWNSMNNGSSKAIIEGEAFGLNAIKDDGITAIKFKWFDTGTIENLEKTRLAYIKKNGPNILEKENESIWFVGKNVIKFSNDKDFIKNRICRVDQLRGYVPPISNYSENMYMYDYIEGEVLSEVINIKLFSDLLSKCKLFWKFTKLNDIQKKDFEDSCLKFYKNKTLERIKMFQKKFNKCDEILIINGEQVPCLSKILENIDWSNLSNGLPGRFHGDFHFENIIYNKNKNFIFLDWRQEFSGNIEIGDIYYDLAKLLHGIIINHKIITDNNFKVEWKKNTLNYDFHRKQILVECESYFYFWLENNGFDLKKVKIITALIFLNISPLHHYPYCNLLYGLGISMLNKSNDL